MRVLFAGVCLKEFARFDFGYHGSSCEFFRVSSALGCVSMLRLCKPDVLFLERDILWGGADGVLAWILEESVCCPSRILVFSGSDLLCEFHRPLRGKRWISEPSRYPNIVLLKNLVQQMEREPDLAPPNLRDLNTFSLRGSFIRTETLEVS